jgi:capsular exopolysaccharide synthesis family protein
MYGLSVRPAGSEQPGGVNPYGGHDPWRLAYPPEDGAWELLRKLWRRKWLVLAVTAASGLAGLFAASSLTPRYTAEARVLVGVQTPNVANIEAVLKGLAANSETIQSEAYLIASRETARSVANRLALDSVPEFNPYLPRDDGSEGGLPGLPSLSGLVEWLRNPSEPADADVQSNGQPSVDDRRDETERMWDIVVSRLLGRTEAVPLSRSHVIAISTESADPELSARIADAFARVYVERQLLRKRQASDDATTWLTARTQELQAKVEESERAVETYRRQHGLYETKSDTIIAQQLGELNRELVAAENAMTTARTRLSQAQSALRGKQAVESLPAVLQSPLIQTLRAQQAELERRAAELSATFTPKHPRMGHMRAQIADVDGKIRAEIGRIVEGLRHDDQMAADRYQRIVAQMEELKGRMGQANAQSVELRELEREAEANRALLTNLLQRSKETAGRQEIEAPDAEIISRAAIPLAPSFPPSTLMLVVAVIGGFGCGALIALMIERLDQTFRTGEEVEDYTGLPALALTPTVRGRRIREYVARAPGSAFAAALRMLNARLSLGGGTNRNVSGVVLFTSSLPREGKTHLSVAFGQLLALDGKRVIVLDLDWRRPSLHRLFGRAPGAGLADLLSGDVTAEQAVFRDEVTGLHAIFAGDVARFANNMLWFDRLRLLLQTLTQHYDVVILDTSPVVIAPEVLHLTRLADKTIFVVKWGSTARRTVASELKNLLRVGGRVSGVVLSQVDPRRYSRYGEGEAGYLHRRSAAIDAA